MHMFTGSTQPLRTSRDPTDKNTKTKTVRYLYIHIEERLARVHQSHYDPNPSFLRILQVLGDRAILNIASLAEAEPVKLHRDQDRCQDHNKVDQHGLT